jgi:hypothetical protein
MSRVLITIILSSIACDKADAVKCGDGTVLKGDTCVVASPLKPPDLAQPPVVPPVPPAPAVDTTPPSVPSGAWTYKSDSDKMRGVVTDYAKAKSTNKFVLRFPYNAGTHLELLLRKGPKSGNEAILHLTSGQVDCDYDGCRIPVKLDDNPVQNFYAQRAGGGDTSALFVQNPLGFIGKLKKAKRAVIEIDLYQEGARQFEFDVSELIWEPYKAKQEGAR